MDLGAGRRYGFKAVPLLNGNGTLLYAGSDSGKVYCLDAPNSDAALQSAGQVRKKWERAFGTPGAVVRVRAPLALSPDGARLYVHTDGPNGGHLHALSAADGTTVAAWGGAKNTGNTGCAVFPPFHGDPALIFSAGPVVDASGNVFVATSGGWVYGYNANGATILQVNLNAVLLNAAEGQTTGVQVEASPALGPNGWLYVATRRYNYGLLSPQPLQSLVAINPFEPTAQKVRWVQHVTTWDPATPGLIAAPVLDRTGFVYAAEFGHAVEQFDATYGTSYRRWTTDSISGKLCATPSLTEDGLLLLPNSGITGCGVAGLLAIRAHGVSEAEPLWQVFSPDLDDGAGGCDGANIFGSPAVRANGWIYFADSGGRVFRITGATPLMEGPWPTLSGGNRRAATPLSYAWQITELFGAYDVNYLLTLPSIASIDVGGRTLGNCYGSFASGYPLSYAGTFWNPIAAQFATYNGGGSGYYYYSQNTRCEAANSLGDIAGASTTSPANALLWLHGALPGASVPYVTLPKPGGAQAVCGSGHGIPHRDRLHRGWQQRQGSPLDARRYCLAASGSERPCWRKSLPVCGERRGPPESSRLHRWQSQV